jgi:hypothetical protein
VDLVAFWFWASLVRSAYFLSCVVVRQAVVIAAKVHKEPTKGISHDSTAFYFWSHCTCYSVQDATDNAKNWSGGCYGDTKTLAEPNSARVASNVGRICREVPTLWHLRASISS